MSENSKIEWTDHTFNPWVGCSKVSPACDNCYAESWAKRAGTPELWMGERRRTTPNNWKQPLKWNANHEQFFAEHGRKQCVFCASLADIFDNQVPDEWRSDFWQMVRDTPNLDWLLLTKRPQNIKKMLPADWGLGYHNVWLGSTVENQKEFNRRYEHLVSIPAMIRFLSMEPLLGGVALKLRGLDWIITGGESGPNARPSHPDWFRSIRDQCQVAGIAFHFKQWGEWSYVNMPHVEDDYNELKSNERWMNLEGGHGFHGEQVYRMKRVGKAKAGRLLDGVEWDGLPAI